MKKISKHAQNRIKERVNEEYSSESKLFKTAIKEGNIKECYSGIFYDYLYKKSLRGKKIVVYNDYIYIMTKNNKVLITVYPVPPCFLPTEQYLISKEQSNIFYYINNLYNKEVKLLVDNKLKVGGVLKNIFGYSYAELIELKTNTGNIIQIDTHHINYIKLDFSNVNHELELGMSF